MSQARESADELIERARRVYAECASYADEGTNSTLMELAAGRRVAKQQRFVTRWRRPGHFFFEYREVQPELVFPGWRVAPGPGDDGIWHVVWANAAGAGSWWTLDKKLEHGTLQSAIAGATGVSGGTAYRIPSLLRVIETPARWFPSSAGFEGEVVAFEGRECLCIPMRTGDQHQQLWLERSSGLVLGFEEHQVFSAESQRSDSQRRVERLREEMARAPETAHRYESLLRSLEKDAQEKAARAPESFTSHSRTVYRPRLNPPLRDDEFEFVPPAVS